MYAVSLKILINVRDAIARVLLENVVTHVADSPVASFSMYLVLIFFQPARRVHATVGIIIVPKMGGSVKFSHVQVFWIIHSHLLCLRERVNINRRRTA